MRLNATRACRVALCVVAVACTPHKQSTHDFISASLMDDGPRVRQRAHLIQESEIRGARVTNALEAVRKLRPDMLSRRAVNMHNDPSGGAAVVYLDRVRQGSFDTLASIPATSIADIRYLTAAAGNDWVGTYHPGGVILVRTRH